MIPVTLILLGLGCNPIEQRPEKPIAESVPQQATEQDVIGAWITQEGSIFEEIIIEEDGRYFTFLRELPLDEGKWFWNDETSQLKLSSTFNEKLSLNFVELEVEEEALFLTDTDDVQHVWWVVDASHDD